MAEVEARACSSASGCLFPPGAKKDQRRMADPSVIPILRCASTFTITIHYFDYTMQFDAFSHGIAPRYSNSIRCVVGAGHAGSPTIVEAQISSLKMLHANCFISSLISVCNFLRRNLLCSC